MANNERRKGHVHFIVCSCPTNLTIALLLSYITTSLLKKYVISKNGHFMPIMAIYEITEAQTNLILVSTPTNLAIAVILTPNATRQLKKLARLGKTLISVQLAPISESCPNLTPVQESLSCSGDNFGPESFIKPCTSDFFRVAGWFSRTIFRSNLN